MDIKTPAFLFSTVSLLMSAYLARFSNMARVMRNLVEKEEEDKEYVQHQLVIFCQRISYIKYLQFCGVLSLLYSTAAMFLILLGFSMAAKVFFGIALILFMLAIIIASIDIYYSTQALSVKLEDEVER